MPDNIKTITIPLSEFLEYAWGSSDRIYVSDSLGQLIKALDSSSIHCHVEFPGDIDGGCLRPTVWRIKDWNSYHLSILARKKSAEKDRIRWAVFSENRQRVIKKLIEITMMDEERVRPLAESMLRKGNFAALRTSLGVYLEDYPKE